MVFQPDDVRAGVAHGLDVVVTNAGVDAQRRGKSAEFLAKHRQFPIANLVEIAREDNQIRVQRFQRIEEPAFAVGRVFFEMQSRTIAGWSMAWRRFR